MSFPCLIWHRDFVLHFPGLEAEQEEPFGRYVQVLVQHTVFGSLVPASHCSPVSTIPSPQTDLGAPDEKSGGGGTTLTELEEASARGCV